MSDAQDLFGTAGTGPAPSASGRLAAEESIRPTRLEDFIGQEELRANLRV